MFRNKIVLITGASSGLGTALARRFARAGAQLILVARRADRLADVADELKTLDAGVTVITADLVKPGACEELVLEVTRDGRNVDVLINNAGVGEYGRFAEQDIDALDRMMRLNMDALVRLTHLLLPPMLERRSGHVMNIASTAAYQPTPYMGVYGATKAFVLSFSMALWEEVRRKGVGVTCICPGPIKTEFFDHGGFGSQKTHFLRTALDPDHLADIAYTKLTAGRAAYVPGLLNKLGVLAQRFVPLRTVTRVSGKLLGPRD